MFVQPLTLCIYHCYSGYFFRPLFLFLPLLTSKLDKARNPQRINTRASFGGNTALSGRSPPQSILNTLPKQVYLRLRYVRTQPQYLFSLNCTVTIRLSAFFSPASELIIIYFIVISTYYDITV